MHPPVAPAFLHPPPVLHPGEELHFIRLELKLILHSGVGRPDIATDCVELIENVGRLVTT